MENKQKQRFYLLMVEQDIFSTWCLKRIWGSLLNRRGRTLVQVFESEKEAWLELTEIEYKKVLFQFCRKYNSLICKGYSEL